MTAWTLDHVDYVPDAAVTSVADVVTSDDVQNVDEQHAQALIVGEQLHPDPAARSRMAAALYAITGWATFGYAELAASETTEEAAERRRIARRRRPTWADED